MTVIMFILFATLMMVGQVMGQKFTCPGQEVIKPCICKTQVNDKPDVSCTGLTSANQLRKPALRLNGYELSSFTIQNSNIGVLPADIFRGIKVRSLTISFTNLTALGDLNRPPFQGLEDTLEELEIRECFLNEGSPLASLSLSHLKKLNMLIFDSNLLLTIGNDWFESGPYQLKGLFLMDASTNVIGSHAFASLIQLKSFWLTGGKFKTLQRKMLPLPAHSLEVIDLDDNQISSLPNDMFRGMPSLREVYLQNNGLSSLNEVIWAPIWNQITHILVSGNQIICDEGLRWIYQYRLPEVLHGECSGPQRLKSRKLDSLKTSDFQ